MGQPQASEVTHQQQQLDYKDVTYKGSRARSQDLEQSSTSNNSTDGLPWIHHSDTQLPEPYLIATNPSRTWSCTSCEIQNLIFHLFHNWGKSPKLSVPTFNNNNRNNNNGNNKNNDNNLIQCLAQSKFIVIATSANIRNEVSLTEKLCHNIRNVDCRPETAQKIINLSFCKNLAHKKHVWQTFYER